MRREVNFMSMGKFKASLFSLLLFMMLMSVAMNAPSSKAQSTDLTLPVGVYEVSVQAPEQINPGEPFNITITVNLTGINHDSPWYNLTIVEGIESIKVSIVEVGITIETTPNIIMLTNLNANLIQPAPQYVFNVTSLTRSLKCGSFTLTPGNYSVHVLIKGFRYAMSGFAVGYFNFYIEKGVAVPITVQVISESIFSSFNLLLAAITIIAFALALTTTKLKRKRRQG